VHDTGPRSQIHDTAFKPLAFKTLIDAQSKPATALTLPSAMAHGEPLSAETLASYAMR
jgi:hypothetical protein